MRSICFTDHVPASDGYDPDNRMEISDFEKYRSIVDEIRGTGGDTEVLWGIEADYYPGCREFLDEWLPAQGFDMVLGSVHYIGAWPFDHPDHKERWFTCDVMSAWREYFEMVCELADTGLYDALAHPDLPKKFGARPPESDIVDMVASAFDRIASSGMAIEVNTSGLRKDAGEIYPSSQILVLAFEREIPICFGSDAHSPSDVGRGFGAGVALAREVGYTEYACYRQREREMAPIP